MQVGTYLEATLYENSTLSQALRFRFLFCEIFSNFFNLLNI